MKSNSLILNIYKENFIRILNLIFGGLQLVNLQYADDTVLFLTADMKAVELVK